MDDIKHRIAKARIVIPTRADEAMFHVGPRLLGFQRLEVAGGYDALMQLLHAFIANLIAKFLLTHQENLQQWRRVLLQVRKQAQFLERVFCKILGLVNNQQRPAARAPVSPEYLRELRNQCRLVQIGRFDVKRERHHTHEVIRLELRTDELGFDDRLTSQADE